MKATALEVLNAAGVPDAEEKIGSVRVRIGGLRGINTPDHKIAFQPETTEVEVLVGEDTYTYNVPQE